MSAAWGTEPLAREPWQKWISVGLNKLSVVRLEMLGAAGKDDIMTLEKRL
jgi:hypothetical protein